MGRDTTISLSFETRDELKDLKIIPEETYDSALQRLIRIAMESEEKDKRIAELERELEELR